MNKLFYAGVVYAEYKQRRFAFFITAIVAFFMSAYYVVGYMAGHLRVWEWDFEQGLNGYASIGLCAAMTFYQFVVYSRGDVSGGKKATIIAVCVAVGFSLLSEVGQGMSRDHVRMETKSQQSPAYKALVQQLGTGTATGSHPYPTELSNAQIKLARCQQKVSAGIWSDCIESTARLNAVQNMIDLHYKQSASRTGALVETVKKWEKDESNYHPLVSLIQDFTGGSFKFASFLLSLILIIFFEYAYHYLGRAVAESKNELLTHGYDVTRKTRKTPKALKQVQENKTPSSTDETWNDELAKSGIDAPDDDVLNQSANDEQARRIVERGQSVPTKAKSVQGTLSEPVEGTLSSDLNHVLKNAYASVKPLIASGQVKPTVRPVTDAVTTFIRMNQETLNIKPSTFTKPQRQQIAQSILERMEANNILVRNKDGGVGKPKYLLSDKYKNRVLGSNEEQISMKLSA